MIKNKIKKKQVFSFGNHHTNYNIVNVCKQSTINGDDDLQIYNGVALSGWNFFLILNTNWDIVLSLRL